MDQNHFQRQMDRLSETFGANHYKAERMKLIWQEVQASSNDWMRLTVDYFIGECKFAPLITDFREAMIKDRERRYSVEKKSHADEAEAFMSAYTIQDIQTICQTIRNRLSGDLNDQDFTCFKKMISPMTRIQCEKCQDSKLFYDSKINGWVVCNHF